MSYPNYQYVLARTSGSRVDYFYGPKIGELVMANIKVGDDFAYAKIKTGPWRAGTRTGKTKYNTEA